MKIDFSAQFGGGDAAKAVLPHFRALKTAAAEVEIPGFPRPQLAFILRVDGQVRSFGFVGLDNVDFDSKGKYVSVDIGIDATSRAALADGSSGNPLTTALEEAAGFLEGLGDARLAETDFALLRGGVDEVVRRYRALVAS